MAAAVNNMAITQQDGAWLKGKHAHWLNYAKILHPDDFSGNEHIQMQDAIRAKISEAAGILKEHNIEIFNIYTMKDSHNAATYETIHRIAIGFEHKEDLLLAKLILKCSV